jgi:predicted transcriptional regulator
MLFKKFKDVFSWTYKDLKGIPPTLIQHIIDLDTSILVAYQTRYKLNPNYVAIVKQDINNLLVVGFIQLVKKATWLSPIVVIFKKNGKLTICVDDTSSNSSRDPKVGPRLE